MIKDDCRKIQWNASRFAAYYDDDDNNVGKKSRVIVVVCDDDGIEQFIISSNIYQLAQYCSKAVYSKNKQVQAERVDVLNDSNITACTQDKCLFAVYLTRRPCLVILKLAIWTRQTMS